MRQLICVILLSGFLFFSPSSNAFSDKTGAGGFFDLKTLFYKNRELIKKVDLVKNDDPLPRELLGIKLGLTLNDVRAIYKLQDKGDPVLDFISKFAPDDKDIVKEGEIINIVLDKKECVAGDKDNKLPAGVSTIGFHFGRNILYDYTITYSNKNNENVKLADKFFRFLVEFRGNHYSGISSNYFVWEDNNTRISISFPSETITIHVSDKYIANILNTEELYIKDFLRMLKENEVLMQKVIEYKKP